MLKIEYTRRMKQDAKRMQKRGKDMQKLSLALDLLACGNSIPPQYRDHPLSGSWNDFRECHIEPDWLLVYQVLDEKLILVATATGTHADLFNI